MSIAYSYIRFSHPDQRRGNSLRRQLGRSRRYAEANGLSLDDTIQDLARSAFHNRHTVTGNLGGFLALAREGEIAAGSYLLVESFDRLSRDEFWPAFELIRDIFKARINLTTLPDDDEVHEYSYDAINKNPTLINEIINDLTRAHRESKIKSVRCRDACEMQREEARAGIAKIPGRCPAWLQPIRGVIIGEDGREKNATIGFKEKTELVEVVRLIFDWALAGLGMGAITSRLNREGRPKFGRTGWHKRTVAVLLHNPEVMGWKQPHKMVDGVPVDDGLPIKDHFPEIIEPDTYWAVQGIIKARHTGAASGRIGNTFPNLLRGIARCTDCGSPLHYIRIGDEFPSQRYLICAKAKRALCDNHTHYLYDGLESELLTILPLVDLSRLIRRTNSQAERGEALAAEIAAKSEQLTALARRKISPEIEAVMDEITDELTRLRADFVVWEDEQRIAEAQASQDNHAQFVMMVARLRDPQTTDDDRFLIRSCIAEQLRRLFEVLAAQADVLTIRFRPAPHQRVEIRLVNQMVESLALWSRDYNHPDYPDNPMRLLCRFSRDVLLDPSNDLIELFGQFTSVCTDH